MPKSQTLEQQAYEIIKKNISTGIYLPGSHLAEADLVKDLQMSRTPIRRALARLNNENYIKCESHYGSIVQDITISMQEMIYILEVRLSFLTSCLKKAKRKKLAYDKETLRDAIDAIEPAVEEKNTLQFIKAVHILDNLIIYTARNSLMLEILLPLWERFIVGATDTVFSGRLQSDSNVVEEYTQIITHLEKQEYDEAIETLEIMTQNLIVNIFV
ncbi:GntR family transcriptional regulator [Clostridium sp.]|uniref:GntR family transcriptional regulator n=1 Tax=Clostridium sp. TaxID=1506 RepID=UPI00321624D1